MNRQIKNLLVKALKGSGSAYRKLGIVFLQGKRCRTDRRLARLFLKKAAEMGDEKGFFLYHRIFSRNKKVIDDKSYKEMLREYRMAGGLREKERIAMYLRLGTKTQKNNNKYTLYL